MEKSRIIFLVFVTAGLLFAFGCKQSKDNSSRQVIQILENEKWWGGAVLDGRNSP